MDAYKILKVPISKEKSVFYYYRRYTATSDQDNTTTTTTLVTLPEDRTIQVCHFVKPIEEGTVHKLFGLAGKIKSMQIGQYKNKANNKRKRRTVYFALVVYKSAEDTKAIIGDPKVLQAKVNKLMRKSVKFSSNPFADEDSVGEESEDLEDPEILAKRQHRE